MRRRMALALALPLLLAACASMPSGPRVAVMPTPGKPFEVFAAEDQQCRQWAAQSLNANGDNQAAQGFAASAALGTAIGAAAGALAGGHEGAGPGAAAGLMVGSAAGSGQAARVAGDAQYRYDIAYQQCMYAHGNQLPGSYRPYSGGSTPAGSYPPPPPLR